MLGNGKKARLDAGWKKHRPLRAGRPEECAGSPFNLSKAKYRLGCLFFILCVVPLFAHAADQKPLTADLLASRIDHHYNALRSLQVNFTQQYDGMGMHRKELGVLLLKKPGKMRWTYRQPAGKLLVIDGHYAYFYSPGESEVQRVPVKQLDDLRSPLRFLLGHTNLAHEFHQLQIAPATGGYTLTGIPKGMEKRIASFSLTATAEGTIETMRIEETDGAVNTFIFTNEQPDAPATDADFVFHAPAGVNVVDGPPPV